MRRKALLLAGVVIGGLATTACRGGSAPALPVTPPPTQSLPTPFPTRTPIVVPTPQVVTPVPAAEAGRPDCPQGWNAYADPGGHFSVCYPSGWFAVSFQSSPEPALSVSVSNFRPREATGPANPIFVTLVWRSAAERPYLEASHCGQFEGVWGVPVEKFTLQVAGVEAEGCRALGTSMNVDEGSFELLVPSDADGGVIEVWMGRAGPDIATTEALTRDILGTLRLREQ